MLRAIKKKGRPAQELGAEPKSSEAKRAKKHQQEQQQKQQHQDTEETKLARERDEAADAERRRKRQEHVALAAGQDGGDRHTYHRGAKATAERERREASFHRLEALWKWPGIKQMRNLANANSNAFAATANSKSDTQEAGVELWFSQLSAVALGVLVCFVVAASFAVTRRRKVRHEDPVLPDEELVEATVESVMPAASTVKPAIQSAATATSPASPMPPPREPRSLRAGTPTTMRRFRVSSAALF